VFWPEDYLKQPLGTGTKQYDAMDIMHMIYDLEEHSDYS